MKKRCICLSIMVVIIGIIVSIKISSKAIESKNNEIINFKVSSTATDTQNVRIEHDAVFNTNYFKEKSTVYNNDLAILSLQLALAASSTSESFDRYGEELSQAHVADEVIDFSKCRNGYLVNAYKAMGFNNDVYYKYNVSLNDTSDRVAHGIASKKVVINNKEYTLVNVTVRGSAYGGEWVSNYRLINEEGAIGFHTAGKEVYEHIKEYIENNKLDSNTKIWICGQSRGGAVANAAAAYIDRACEDGTFDIERENVYSYSIAAPSNIIDEDGTEVSRPLYDNLMNVIYESDVIVLIPPIAYGCKKYGEIYQYPTINISSKDMKRIKEGKKPKNKNLTEEDIAMARSITEEYHKIRYGSYPEEYEKVKDDLYKGFSVEKEFGYAVNAALCLSGDTPEEGAEKLQKIMEQVIPFVIGRAKKYDETTQTWVKYNNIKEYLECRYGKEVYNKAIEQGVYSEEEYTDAKKRVENLYNKGLVNEENKEKIQLMVDTYYGIKVLAVNCNINKEFMQIMLDRLGDSYKEIISGCIPVSNVKNCMSNHYGEFYLALLRTQGEAESIK